MAGVRLDKLLSNRGYCTRSEVNAWLRRGLIECGGQVPQSASQKVDPAQVTLEGQALDDEFLYILIHKPQGYVCSHKDAGLLLFELFPERWCRRNPQINCVGRLDKDTTGALLLTDDGALLHRLSSPRYHVPKVYEADLACPLTPEQVELLSAGGMVLEGDNSPLKPAELSLLARQDQNRELAGAERWQLTLTEGRYHQVKRMFEAVDNQVLKLHRRQFGFLGVADLSPGEFRLLEPAEVARLQGKE